MNNQKIKNRIFEQEIPFGKKNPISLSTKEEFVYRVTGMSQIDDIINCGYVRPKEGKIKGGHYNEVFWTHGGSNLYYYDKRPVIEVPYQIIKENENTLVNINNLSAIWIFNEEEQKYVNDLLTIKHKHLEQEKEQLQAIKENKLIK